jgi:hypothetical protein
VAPTGEAAAAAGPSGSAGPGIATQQGTAGTTAGDGGARCEDDCPEDERFELLPRWPLTSERHPSSMGEDRRGARTARMAPSLTDMDAAAARTRAAAAAGAAAGA